MFDVDMSSLTNKQILAPDKKGNNRIYLPTIRVCVECPRITSQTKTGIDETNHFMPRFSGDFYDKQKTRYKKGDDMNLANPLTMFFLLLGKFFLLQKFYHFGESPLFTTQSQLGGETSNIF